MHRCHVIAPFLISGTHSYGERQPHSEKPFGRHILKHDLPRFPNGDYYFGNQKIIGRIQQNRAKQGSHTFLSLSLFLLYFKKVGRYESVSHT